MRSHPRPLATLVLLAALGSAAPPAEAQAPASAFGSVVHAGDADAFPMRLAAVPGAALCFVDTDGSGDATRGEPVVFATAGCPVPGRGFAGRPAGEGGDLRISGPRAGTRIAAGDPDAGEPLFQLAFTLRFADLNRDGLWSQGDAMYLQPGPEHANVTPGDLRLTAYGRFQPGSFVAAGDADAGFATTGRVASGPFLAGTPAAWKFWDADGDGRFDGADLLYLDLDGTGSPTVMDVRLTPYRGLGFGTALAGGDPDAVPALQPFGPGPLLCFVGRAGNEAYTAGDPVFFERDGCPLPGPGVPGKALREGDVRLTAPGAGTKVAGPDPDFGAPSFALPAARLAYADVDRDGEWSAGDTAYVAMGAGVVSVGDVRATRFGSFPPGTTVQPGDSDLGLVAAAFPNTLADLARWWDVDGNQQFGGADALYFDVKHDNRVGPLDLRVTPLGAAPFGAKVAEGDPDLRPALQPLSARALCAADNATDGARGLARVYLGSHPCGRVQRGDLRLAGPQAGTFVAEVDADANASEAPWPGGADVRFYASAGRGAWSAGDTLYLFEDANRSAVAAGDLRLTGYGGDAAGAVVQPGDADLDLPTVAAPVLADLGDWRWWDVDGDSALGRGDVLYIDADASGDVSPLDVRLTAMPLSSAPAPEIVGLEHAVDALQASLAEREREVQGLQDLLDQQNATLAQLVANNTSLAQQNEGLQARLAARPPARTPGPGAPELLAALGVAVALAAAARRP